MAGDRFSKRFGYSTAPVEIQVREDAPAFVRGALPQIAYEVGLPPAHLRNMLCTLLRVRPNPGNWSPSSIEAEVDELLADAEWYRVYDFIEVVFHELLEVSIGAPRRRAAASSSRAPGRGRTCPTGFA